MLTFRQGGTVNSGDKLPDFNGAFTLSGGQFIASSATSTFAANVTISNASLFVNNGGTVNFDSALAGILACGNTSFNFAIFTHSGNNAKTVGADCTLPLGNNPTVGTSTLADLTVNGTLTGTGRITGGLLNGNNFLTLNSTAQLNGFTELNAGAFATNSYNGNFSAYTFFAVNGQYIQTGGTISAPNNVDINNTFVLNSGATFNAPSGNSYFASSFTVNSGTTFNANGGTTYFDGTTGTLTCNNTAFQMVYFAHTSSKSVGAQCNLPLGANPSIPGGIDLSGTLTGTGTLTNAPNTVGVVFGFQSGSALAGFTGFHNRNLRVVGGTTDFSNFSFVTVGGSLTLLGGNLIAPPGLMKVGSSFAGNAGGGTFDGNGGTVEFTDNTTNGASVITCSGVNFSNVRFAHTTTPYTIATGCDLPLGNNPVLGGSASTTSVHGTLSGTGTLITPGIINVNFSALYNGFSDWQANKVVNLGAATFSLAALPTTTITSDLTLTAGTLTAPSGALSIGGNIVAADNSFIHNGGDVILSGTNQSISGNIGFYDLTKSAPQAAILTLASSNTVTIDNDLTLSGTIGNKLQIKASTAGTQSIIAVVGTASIDYVTVQDSNNTSPFPLTARNSVDHGNNINWDFAGIDISFPKSYQVIQRNGSNTANITVSGTYSGNPTSIEASWNGGLFEVIAAQPSGGKYSGTLANRSVGQGTLTVRFSGSSTTYDTRTFVGIGDVYVVAGQSNASGRGASPQPYTSATYKASLFGNNDVWQELADPTDSNTGAVDAVSTETATPGGSVWPLIATRLIQEQQVPVAFIPTAKGGTTIAQWQRNTSVSTLYGSLYRRVTAVGPVKAVLFWQGESDALNGTPSSTYKTSLQAFTNAIQSDFGVKTVVAQIGPYAGTTPENLAAIRQAQQQAWDEGGSVLTGPILADIPISDPVHYVSDSELQAAADRWWSAMRASLYSQTTPVIPIPQISISDGSQSTGAANNSIRRSSAQYSRADATSAVSPEQVSDQPASPTPEPTMAVDNKQEQTMPVTTKDQSEASDNKPSYVWYGIATVTLLFLAILAYILRRKV